MTDEKKQKIKEETLGKLNEALLYLTSEDIKLKKKGERHLSDRSRMALGDYKAQVVADWFLNDKITEQLFKIILQEKEDIIQAELIHMLYWVCCKHVKYRQIELGLSVNEMYLNKVRAFIYNFPQSRSVPVLAALAAMYAFYGDNCAWDIFYTVLQKKRDYLTLARFGYAYEHNEGQNFISEEQKNNLIEILKTINEKTSNKEVKSITAKLMNKL